MKTPINIFWFRRDLRLSDNAGLYHALKGGYPVLPIFIFDTNILSELENKNDQRVNFIYEVLAEMQEKLQQQGTSLYIHYGTPENAFIELLQQYNIKNVYTNGDYEPYARERDKKIAKLLDENDIDFKSYKDQVIFEKDEVVKDDGKPYTVFTPYSRKWKVAFNDHNTRSYPTEKHFDNFFKTPPLLFPSLDKMGFEEMKKNIPQKICRMKLLSIIKKTGIIQGLKAHQDLASTSGLEQSAFDKQWQKQ